jgi:hypothetical protein
MKAAQSTLLKYLHRIRDLSAHQQYHQTLADQLEAELQEREADGEALFDAAWASLAPHEHQAFGDRISAIDPEFMVFLGEREELRREREAEDALNEYHDSIA